MLKEVLDMALAARCVIGSNNLRKEFNTGVLTLSCLAAFDYQMRHQGVELTDQQKREVFVFLELGKVINNFYDDSSPLPVNAYKGLRRQLFPTPLSCTNFLFYYSSVASLEKNRPNPWVLGTPCLEQVEQYRYKTNLVYWAAACTTAGVTKDITSLVSTDIDFIPSSPRWFQGMHSFLLALQVIDDKIGWKGDLRLKRPSFFTALCPGQYLATKPEQFPTSVVASVYQQMDERFFVYMDNAEQQLPDNYAMRQAINALRFIPNMANIRWYKRLQTVAGVDLVNTHHFNE